MPMPIPEDRTLHLPPPILASASPRRKQWMEALQIPFQVWAPDVDEAPLAGEEPGAMVARLAGAKAAAVALANPDRWVIAADTTVAVDHHVLGKVFLRPVSLAQAQWYAGTGEPMDKAGGYAAQGIAALFIDRIEGSFATVMGFPVERFGELVGRLGLLGSWLGMP